MLYTKLSLQFTNQETGVGLTQIIPFDRKISALMHQQLQEARMKRRVLNHAVGDFLSHMNKTGEQPEPITIGLGERRTDAWYVGRSGYNAISHLLVERRCRGRRVFVDWQGQLYEEFFLFFKRRLCVEELSADTSGTLIQEMEKRMVTVERRAA